MAEIPNPIEVLLRAVAENVGRTDASRRASTLIDLSILTLLIDAKICSIEEAVARIELLHKTMPERYRDEETSARITVVATWLRAHAKGAAGWTPRVVDGGRSDWRE